MHYFCKDQLQLHQSSYCVMYVLHLQESWTAMMAATNNGRYEVVDLLLQKGAIPDMQDHVS